MKRPLFSQSKRLLIAASLAALAARHAISIAVAETPPGVTPSANAAAPSGLRFNPDIVRFLRQATFGPSRDLINYVQQVGTEAYLREQFASAGTPYLDLTFGPQNPPASCAPRTVCERERYTMFLLQKRFFTDALFGEAQQLRQRASLAFQQVFNVSGSPPLGQAAWMQEYVRAIENNVFGNYQQMLYDVALNPAMGRYLDMLDNKKFDPQTGIRPNENFARELLQLFTTGLFEMNLDGSYLLDGDGNRVPIYTQTDVEELARVCTGWVKAPNLPGNYPNYRDPMIPQEDDHDAGAKTVLGRTIPAGLSTREDLIAALNIIFDNRNTPVFIAKRLIQHFVTSNPAPNYVARVASTFIDNGRGERGDLKAVLSAILLDPEARGESHSAEDYGKLQEPVLFLTNILRAFDATSDAVLNYQTAAQGQSVLVPPDVFGFYDPFHTIDTSGQFGPVFSILSTQTAIARANLVDQLSFMRLPPLPGGSSGTSIQEAGVEPYRPIAANSVALVEALENVLVPGGLSPATRDIVIRAVEAIPTEIPSQILQRVRTARYLILVSPEFQIQR